jgi:hypothetical protein
LIACHHQFFSYTALGIHPSCSINAIDSICTCNRYYFLPIGTAFLSCLRNVDPDMFRCRRFSTSVFLGCKSINLANGERSCSDGQQRTIHWKTLCMIPVFNFQLHPFFSLFGMI